MADVSFAERRVVLPRATALSIAAQKGEFASVKRLLRQKAPINSMDDAGKTPLMYAAQEGHTSCVDMLLKSGADASIGGQRIDLAHVLAVESGHVTTAALILSQGLGKNEAEVQNEIERVRLKLDMKQLVGELKSSREGGVQSVRSLFLDKLAEPRFSNFLEPMHLMSFAEFERQGKIERFGSQGLKLVSLDSVPDNGHILFVSHRWLTPDGSQVKTVRGAGPQGLAPMHPDTEDQSKWKLIMEGVVELALERGIDLNRVYIWLDYTTLAQDGDTNTLLRGRWSLPAYVACSDTLLAVAHESYWWRAWTRLEQLLGLHFELPRLEVTDDSNILRIEDAPEDPETGELSIEEDRKLIRLLAAVTTQMPQDRPVDNASEEEPAACVVMCSRLGRICHSCTQCLCAAIILCALCVAACIRWIRDSCCFDGKYEEATELIEKPSTDSVGSGSSIIVAPRLSKDGKHPFNSNDFEKLSVLGRGSFGNVVMARGAVGSIAGRVYALKVCKVNEAELHNLVEYSKSGRQILRKITCPFIAELLCAFQSGPQLHLVFELYENKLFGDGIILLETSARVITAEIILGLEAVHAANLVFRKLTPDNVLLSAHGHVRLSSYGASVTGVQRYVRRQHRRTSSRSNSPSFGSKHTIEDYLAPELLSCDVNDWQNSPSVDWWSLGVLTHEMLTGTPVPGKDAIDGVSVEANSFVRALLKSDPASRLGSGVSGCCRSHPFFSKLDWNQVLQEKVDIGIADALV